MAVTRGQNFNTQVAGSAAAFGAVNQAVGTASRLSSAVSAGYAAGGVGTAIRAINLPAGGEAIGDIFSAVASFGGDANANDWRVRLSLPTWPSFRTSPVLKPLKDAGGLVFPYTPQINISSGANYTRDPITHSNFAFHAFKNSEPGSIELTAPLNVEDSKQALYWIAAVHYLRSVSKMFAGNDPKAGNPPPIVFLNGYGNFVFKNVPVVVTKFSLQLPQDCDYIGCEVRGSAAGAVAGVADSIGGLADTLGSLGGELLGSPGIPGITSAISEAAGVVGQVAGLLGTFGVGGSTSGGIAHVPTKSSLQLTLMPVYSRTSARKFSLDRFVTGGYLNNSFGYI
jgi:hypothetical protein